MLVAHARPLARPADDRRRGGRRRRLRAEADQRRRRRGPGHARRRPQAQPRRAGRHAAPQHAAPRRGPRQHHSRRAGSARSPSSRSTATTTCGPATIRPTPPRPTTSTTRCGPGPRPMRPYNALVHPAVAGGPSWSTATASSATCASTCSTWSAGCSTSAGRSSISSTGGILVDKAEQGQHHRHADGHVRLRRPQRRLDAPHLGPGRRTRISLGRHHLRRQGHAQGERA